MKCIVCNEDFLGHHSKKLCSDDCRKKRERKLGREHYYKHRDKMLVKTKAYQSSDKYKQRKKSYDKERRKNISPEYKKMCRDKDFFGGNRENALMRDEYKCVKCGTTKSLIVHHIDCSGAGKKMLPKKDTNNELENLETLCRSCHMKEHLAHIDKTNPISQHRHEY